MKTVAIESPYAARAHFTVEDNVHYARLCMGHALDLGEAPFLSHLLYTQVGDDTIPYVRRRGIDAGLAISAKLDYVAVYYDLGISPGMAQAIAHYREIGKRCWLRRIFSPAIGRALRAGDILSIPPVRSP